MATCPRCALRTIRARKTSPLHNPNRTFHTSPTHNRLGAFTYAQEWQTGSYHYNKSLSKTLPMASQRTDELLQNYATQFARTQADPSNPLYKQTLRNSIVSQRRKPDRYFISKSTAKDFGDRVEVTAFVYDQAVAEEQARLAAKRKREEARGAQRKRGPARRRGAGPAGAGGRGGRSTGGPMRTGGPARTGGPMRMSAAPMRSGGMGARRPGGFGGAPRQPGGAPRQPGGTTFKSLDLGRSRAGSAGAGAGSRPSAPARSSR